MDIEPLIYCNENTRFSQADATTMVGINPVI